MAIWLSLVVGWCAKNRLMVYFISRQGELTWDKAKGKLRKKMRWCGSKRDVVIQILQYDCRMWNGDSTQIFTLSVYEKKPAWSGLMRVFRILCLLIWVRYLRYHPSVYRNEPPVETKSYSSSGLVLPTSYMKRAFLFLVSGHLSFPCSLSLCIRLPKPLLFNFNNAGTILMGWQSPWTITCLR